MLQYTKKTVIIMDVSSEAQDVEYAILSNESNQGIVLHQRRMPDIIIDMKSTTGNKQSVMFYLSMCVLIK